MVRTIDTSLFTAVNKPRPGVDNHLGQDTVTISSCHLSTTNNYSFDNKIFMKCLSKIGNLTFSLKLCSLRPQNFHLKNREKDREAFVSSNLHYNGRFFRKISQPIIHCPSDFELKFSARRKKCSIFLKDIL